MAEEHNLPVSKKEPPNGGPATWLGLRRSALLEIGLFLSVALAVDSVFFGGTRYWDIAPHPFWLLVLLIGAQYGTNEGMVAAAMASAALLVYNLPEQTLSQDRYDYLFHLTLRPLMWFSAALVFGELRMRQIREREKLRAALSATEEREQTVASAYGRLSQAKEHLEIRIAGQVRTAINLSQAAKAIEKLDPSEVLFGVVDVVRAVMFPEKFSLYLLKNGSLEVSIQEGWSADDKFLPVFPPGSRLFQQMIGRQEVLCSANPEDEQVLASEGILAGPVVHAEMGEVLGMLKVERSGFLDLNFSSVNTFKTLCEWIGTAYANALLYQAARSESILSYDTQLLSYGFFSRQTPFLAELAARIHFDLSMIVLRLENAEDLTVEDLNQIPTVLGQTVGKILRRSDLVFDYQRTGWEFALVLPGTSIDNIPIIADKVLAGLKASLPGSASQARFSVTSHALHREERMADRDRMISSQELFRKQTDSLTNLAKRMGFDLAMIGLRVDNMAELTEEEYLRIPEVVGQAIGKIFPADDPAFAYQRSDLGFMVLLPDTSIGKAQRASEQLLAHLTSQPGAPDSKARFSSTIQALHSRRRLMPSRV